MRARDLSFDCDTLHVRPWVDPVVDEIGHDPRSDYVERFWLAILGPSTTFFLRHLVERFEAAPDGFELVLPECASALGLGRLQSAGAAFPRTIGRTCQFGAGRLAGPGALEVRRKLPPLTSRQVRRLPPSRQVEHARWGQEERSPLSVLDERDRARRLALSLVELGEDAASTERQLHRWQFHPAVSHDATAWALSRHAERPAVGDRAGTAGTGTESTEAERTDSRASGRGNGVVHPARPDGPPVHDHGVGTTTSGPSGVECPPVGPPPDDPDRYDDDPGRYDDDPGRYDDPDDDDPYPCDPDGYEAQAAAR